MRYCVVLLYIYGVRSRDTIVALRLSPPPTPLQLCRVGRANPWHERLFGRFKPSGVAARGWRRNSANKAKKNIDGFLPVQTLSGFSASDESKKWKSDDYRSVANADDFQGAVLHFKGKTVGMFCKIWELLHFLNNKWTINNSSDSVGEHLTIWMLLLPLFGAAVRERLAYPPNNKLIIQIRCPFFVWARLLFLTVQRRRWSTRPHKRA